MKQASLELAAIHNLVPEDLKEEYSNYTLQNYAKWVNESLQTSEEAQKDFSPVGFKPYIWGRGPDGPYADMGRESSYSIWTISPIPTNYGLLNWNAITLPDFKAMDEAMHVLKNETVFVGIRPYAAFNEEAHKKMHAEGQDPNSFPHTFMWHPIHENAEDYNSKIVGAAGGAMAYDASMRNLLPRGVQGIVCVLRNNFNQTFSYSIDGPEAYFLGMEDFHDPKYDHMKREVDLALHTNPAYPTTPGHCMYRMVSFFYNFGSAMNSFDLTLGLPNDALGNLPKQRIRGSLSFKRSEDICWCRSIYVFVDCRGFRHLRPDGTTA